VEQNILERNEEQLEQSIEELRLEHSKEGQREQQQAIHRDSNCMALV
jgi:hypothetical protein